MAMTGTFPSRPLSILTTARLASGGMRLPSMQCVASFFTALVLLAVTYHPPTIDGTDSKNIQETAFHAFVLFFTSCVSLWVGKRTK